MSDDLTVIELRDLVIPERVVEIPGTKSGFVVRGLDLYKLLVTFKDNLDALDLLVSGQVSAEMVEEMIDELPNLVAHIISNAAGDAASFDLARKLPVQVQAIALKEIFELSFPDEDLMGKFWAWLEEKTDGLAKAYRSHLSGQTS